MSQLDGQQPRPILCAKCFHDAHGGGRCRAVVGSSSSGRLLEQCSCAHEETNGRLEDQTAAVYAEIDEQIADEDALEEELDRMAAVAHKRRLLARERDVEAREAAAEREIGREAARAALDARGNLWDEITTSSLDMAARKLGVDISNGVVVDISKAAADLGKAAADAAHAQQMVAATERAGIDRAAYQQLHDDLTAEALYLADQDVLDNGEWAKSHARTWTGAVPPTDPPGVPPYTPERNIREGLEAVHALKTRLAKGNVSLGYARHETFSSMLPSDTTEQARARALIDVAETHAAAVERAFAYLADDHSELAKQNARLKAQLDELIGEEADFQKMRERLRRDYEPAPDPGGAETPKSAPSAFLPPGGPATPAPPVTPEQPPAAGADAREGPAPESGSGPADGPDDECATCGHTRQAHALDWEAHGPELRRPGAPMGRDSRPIWTLCRYGYSATEACACMRFRTGPPPVSLQGLLREP